MSSYAGIKFNVTLSCEHTGCKTTVQTTADVYGYVKEGGGSVELDIRPELPDGWRYEPPGFINLGLCCPKHGLEHDRGR